MKTLTRKQKAEAKIARKDFARSNKKLDQLRWDFARNVRREVCQTLTGRDERLDAAVTEALRLGLWTYNQRSHVRYALIKRWFRQDGLKRFWNFVRWRDENLWEAYTWKTDVRARAAG